jgi:hypothetical protein
MLSKYIAMKTIIHRLPGTLKALFALVATVSLVSCGGYTEVSYSDGIYGSNRTVRVYEDVQEQPQTYQNNSSGYYESLFASEAENYGNNFASDSIFTDVEGYSSESYDAVNPDYTATYGGGAPAWGTNPSEVNINFYNGGFGYGGFGPGFGFGGFGPGFGYGGFGPGFGFGFNRFGGFGGFGYSIYDYAYLNNFYGGFGFGFGPFNRFGGFGFNRFGYGGFYNGFYGVNNFYGRPFYRNNVAFSNGYRSSRNNVRGIESRLDRGRTSSRAINRSTRGRATTTSRRAVINRRGTTTTRRSSNARRGRTTTTRRSSSPSRSRPVISPSRSSRSSSSGRRSTGSRTRSSASPSRSSSRSSGSRSSSRGRSSGRRG